jgi:hypothetical protein
MSKTEDKSDEKVFSMKGESSRGGYNPSRGRANSDRGGKGQGRSNQAYCYNKQREKKTKQIIQKRRINNQFSS